MNRCTCLECLNSFGIESCLPLVQIDLYDYLYADLSEATSFTLDQLRLVRR